MGSEIFHKWTMLVIISAIRDLVPHYDLPIKTSNDFNNQYYFIFIIIIIVVVVVVILIKCPAKYIFTSYRPIGACRVYSSNINIYKGS